MSAAVLKALIPIGIMLAVWVVTALTADRWPIVSCPALRNVCHDAADDVAPYAVIVFSAACAIAAIALFIMG